MADPWAFWSAADIARITGCPVGAITRNWPLIADALERRGIYERDVCLGLLATVAIETASTFEPIDEYPDPRRYPDTGGYPPHYEGGPDFHGRGFLQVTHRGNYRQAGDVVGRDLVANPALANDPKIAAEILAWWFDTKGVPSKDGSRFYTLVDLCREHDWQWVRRAVQGGTAGLDRLVAIASALDAYKEPGMPTRVTFNRDFPPTIQDDDWSCAPSSLDWALRSLGRAPGHSYIENLLLKDGIVSRELGLLDASGGPLADWIGKKVPADVYYGADGFYGNNQNPVSFQAVAEEIGPYPLLIGGRNWGGPTLGHWSGVRGYDRARDVLLLANPAGSGPTFGGQEMTRQQFSQRGPFSMVRVLHPDLLEASPAPPPPPPDTRERQRSLIAEIKTRVDELAALVG